MKRIAFFVSVLIAVMTVFGMLLTVGAERDFEAEEKMASELKDLGIFNGVSDDDFALDRKPTRVEAVVMLIRFLGKEDEVLGEAWRHPFGDVPEWADKYVGYAYSKGLVNGVSDTEFGTGNASAEMYITFVLRAYGYSDEDGKDFKWDDPYTLAKDIGILPENLDTENFLRADFVAVSYKALDSEACIKDTKTPLHEKLIDEKVFNFDEFCRVFRKEEIHNYDKICSLCGQRGHEAEDCQFKTCEFCGSSEHSSAVHPSCSWCGRKDHTSKEHDGVMQQEAVENSHSTEKCSFCDSTEHKSAEHVCTKCGVKGHEGVEKICEICGSKGHEKERHLCEYCGGFGHDFSSCDNRCIYCDGHHSSKEHVCEACGKTGHGSVICVSENWCEICKAYDHKTANHPCEICGKKGHQASDCTVKWCKYCRNFSHTSVNHVCEECGSKGHDNKHCPEKTPYCEFCTENSHSTGNHHCSWCDEKGHEKTECMTKKTECGFCGSFVHETHEHICEHCDKRGHDISICDELWCKYCGKKHTTAEHVCGLCGETGHRETVCPNAEKYCEICASTEHNKNDHICNYCCIKGHSEQDCVYCIYCEDYSHKTKDHPRCNVCGKKHSNGECDE